MDSVSVCPTAAHASKFQERSLPAEPESNRQSSESELQYSYGALPKRAILRWIEMIVIFFGIPVFVAVFLDPKQRLRPFFDASGADTVFNGLRVAAGMVIPLLLLITVISAFVLVRDPTFENRRLWNWKPFKRDAKRIVGIFLVLGAGLLGVAWLLSEFTGILSIGGADGSGRSAFLYLPRELPWALLFIAIGYPIFSAYPQEILCRAFFFHRYHGLFPNTASMVVVNAVAFMWLHAPFWSLEAFAITLPGGFLFAYTYLRTRSCLAAGVEHALYGWWAFFTGLGWFVFTGSIGA